jgi:amino acid transporter
MLLFHSNSDFIRNFNTVMAPYFPGVTNAYQHIIDTAKAAGWTAGSGAVDWWKTFLFASWPFMAYIGAAFSISIGGEIRSGGRGQFIGIIAAIIASTIAFIILGTLSVRVFGSDFLGAVSYNFYNGVQGGAVPSAPWITLLIAILVRNPWLALFINLSFIAWIWLWIPGMQVYADRAFVAWSFDRLAPDGLGKVSERTHTPINAIALAVLGTIILLALYVFTPYFTTVIMIEAAALAWFVVLFAGIFFPYRKKSLYEKSPLAHNLILGLPAQTVACFLGSIGAGIAFIFMWNDNFAAGHSPYSLAVMGGFILAGLIIYTIMYYYRKSKGINVNECFKEIPCE